MEVDVKQVFIFFLLFGVGVGFDLLYFHLGWCVLPWLGW